MNITHKFTRGSKSPECYQCSTWPSDAMNQLSAAAMESWFSKMKSNGVRNCKSVIRFYYPS